MESLYEGENVSAQYPEVVFEMQTVLRKVRNNTLKEVY